MPNWSYPLDPNCPEVKKFMRTLHDDPMTHAMGAPVDDIEEGFTRKHRVKCKRCQAYGAAHVEVESKESVKMNLLNELLTILEKDTPGLDLGNFKLDDEKGVICATIHGKHYDFTPKDKKLAELFASVTGMAKHSTGRALAYLRQHATGKLAEEAE